MKPNIKKLLILNAPYLLFVYLFDKVGQAVRLSPGADLSGKLLSIGSGFSAAFSNALPSFAPTDLLIGIVGAVVIRLAVYVKGKNAKKYRKGMEYGTARWSDLRTFPSLFGDLLSAFSQLEDSLRSGAMLLILQIFLACVLGVIVSTLIVYAAYAVGYSFNKHKGAITAVLLLVFYQLVQLAGLRLTFGVADSERFSQAWSAHTAMSFVHSFFTMALVGELVSCAIFYLITWYFTTRKLNLE